MKKLSLLLPGALLVCASALAHDIKVIPLDDLALPIVEADAHVDAAPPSIDFETVPIGIPWTPESQNVVVQNPSLETQEVAVYTEDPGAPLTIRTGDEAFTLPPGGTHTVEITFVPSGLGDDLATDLVVRGVDPKGYSQAAEVALTGSTRQATPPDLVLRHSQGGPEVTQPLSFLAEVGANDTKWLWLENTGEQAVDSGTMSGLAHLMPLPCWWDLCFYDQAGLGMDSFTLAGGSGMAVQAIFEPGHAWAPNSSQALSFYSEEPAGTPASFTVSVEAEDPAEEEPEAHLTLSPNLHDFGAVPPGQSRSVTLQLTNIGTAAATSGIEGLTNGNCDVLGQNGDGICFSPSSYTLQPGDQIAIQVTFAPAGNSNIPPFVRSYHMLGGAHPVTFTALGAATSQTEGVGGGGSFLPGDIGLRGLVNEQTFHSSGDIDHVNTLNGNLVVTLPIGPAQRIGPSLSHGLSLVYNSSLWDPVPLAGESYPGWGNLWEEEPSTAPAWGTNAGLGWQLSLGGLYQPLPNLMQNSPNTDVPHWPNQDPDYHWLYVAPDGSRIYFESDGQGKWKSIGNQYLRLSFAAKPATSNATLEFPDGSKHQFQAHTQSCGTGVGSCHRLNRIEDAFGNFATVSYAGFQTGGSGSASIQIHYPHSRTTTIHFDRQPTAADPDQVAFRATSVAFPAGIGPYTLRYAGSPGPQDVQMVRGCIGGVGNTLAGSSATLGVPLLTGLELPHGLTYDFDYFYSPSAVGQQPCDPMAGLLESVTLPTQSRIRYRWGDRTMPGVCEGFAPEGSPSRPQGVKAREVYQHRNDPLPIATTKYVFHTANPVLFKDPFYRPQGAGDPLTCERDTTAVTEVIHSPDVLPGEGGAELYLGERFYHALLRPTDCPQPGSCPPVPNGGQWIKAVHGLPVDMHNAKSGAFGGTLWLSGESLECATDIVTPSCEVQRRTYRHYELLEADAGGEDGGFDRPHEDKVRYQRRRDAMNRERMEYGPDGTKWVETYYSDWDGRGHYRQSETKSSLCGGGSGSNCTTSSERTEYLGGSPSGLNDALPTAGAPWLLDLYTARVSNPNGMDLITHFQFDPDNGFLECRRALGGLTPVGTDLATRFEPVGSTTNGERGFVDWEGLAGGDGGGAGSSGCPTGTTAFQLRTQYTYEDGELASAQPLDGNSEIGPLTVDRSIDAATGRITHACDHSTSPATCEKYSYDLLGRRTLVDRGWQLNGTSLGLKPSADRLADTSFSFDLLQDGGAEVVGKLQTSPTNILDQETLELDPLGREHELRTLTSAGEVVARSRYHGRGFKTQEVTPELVGGPARPCESDDSSCTTVYRYDVFGRVIETISASLNDMDAPDRAGDRQTTTVSRGAGDFYEKVKRAYGNSQSAVETWSDHLGRVWRVRETPDTGSGGVFRQTTTWRSNYWTTTVRDAQQRALKHDGRGFLVREQQPEWEDGATLYQYDALGNVTRETLPDGSVIETERDALGRVERVKHDGKVVKELEYDLGTGKLDTAIRYSQVDCAAYQGRADCGPEARVEERFQYDSNGQLASQRTLVYWPWGGHPGSSQLLYDTNQGWSYDPAGRVDSTTYPDCTGVFCGTDQAPIGRLVRQAYSQGDLVGIDLGTTPLVDFVYHPNGVLQRVGHYESGTLQWLDLIRTPDSGMARVEKTEVARPGTPGNPVVVWSSGELIYNPRGVLEQIHAAPGEPADADLDLSYDGFDRLVQYQRDSSADPYTYEYDPYDNLTRLEFAPSSAFLYSIDSNTNRITQLETPGGEQNILNLPPTEAKVNPQYDARGFLTQLHDIFLRYDALGEVERYQQDAYQAIHFYNAADQRVVTVDYLATGNEDRAIFFGRDLAGKVLRELHNDGVDRWYKDFVWSGRQLRAFDDGTGGWEHVHPDHLGSPRVMTRAGVVTATQEFDPWGLPVVEANTMPHRIGFTGHEMDRNHSRDPAVDGKGLSYDFGARSYVPAFGRFLSPDPGRDRSSWSLYGYAGASPLMNVDPDGLLSFPWEVLDLYSYNQSRIAWAEAAQEFTENPSLSTGLVAAAKFLENSYDSAALLLPVLPGAMGLMDNITRAADDAAVLGTDLVRGADGQATGFVVTPGGEAVLVPEGARGPSPAEGAGFRYEGGSGGRGLDARVTEVRIMDPTPPRGPSPGYPGGYVSYSNGNQTVHPFTGRTLQPSDPMWHIPLKPGL